MLNLSALATELQARANSLTNQSTQELVIDIALAVRKGEAVGLLIDRTVLDAQLQRVTSAIGAGTTLEDLLGISVGLLRENVGYPVGTTVDNYLPGNDGDNPNWIKLGQNVTADLTAYPKLAGLQGQGMMTFTALPANNLAALLSAVSGTWIFTTWKILNGVHVVIARENAGATNYYRSFTSSDGVTFVEKGNLTASVAVGNGQSNLYYLNGKYYLVSPFGIYESANSGETWSRKTSTYYYSMYYAFGLYVIGNTQGEIFTTSDFVTITKRATATSNSPVVNFELVGSRLFVAVHANSTQFKYMHSTDAINWVEVQINSYTASGNIGYYHVRGFNNRVLLIGETREVTLQSDDGLTNWVQVPTITSTSIGFDNGTLVAGDTIYFKGGFSADTSSSPRASSTTANQQICKDSVNVFLGNLGTNSLQLWKFPIANNAGRVFLPNVNNKMMKVR